MNHKIKSKPITELGSKQLLTYLKLKGLRLGFVLNFRGSLMKDGIERSVNGLSDVNLGVLASWREAEKVELTSLDTDARRFHPEISMCFFL